MADFSHFNEDGRAKMVDVGGKDVTARKAVAVGRVLVNEECFKLIKTGGLKKGDVLGTAQIAIPMCHPIMINGANIRFHLNEEDLAVEIESEVKCSGVTGVEMEALTAVSIAALTVYDMCKAVQKDMVIDKIHLVTKSGGKSGDFVWGK